MVAQINKLESSELEEFLFGSPRRTLEGAKRPLLELQEGRCFYCRGRIRSAAEVDHFIPRVRYPDDGIHNLVVADRSCNNNKRDRLAAASYVEDWVRRGSSDSAALPALNSIAEKEGLDQDFGKTIGIARGVYLRLPEGTPLWAGFEDLVDVEPERLFRALS